MSIKVAQNDFTRKMNDFDTFTKIAYKRQSFVAKQLPLAHL